MVTSKKVLSAFVAEKNMQTSTLFGRRIETGKLSLLEHDKPSSLILSDARVDTTVGYLQRQLQDAIKDIGDEDWIS
jgi:hypothetical protein